MNEGLDQQRNPSHEEIARRAYEIYRERGEEDGQDVEDWLAAETELHGQPSESGQEQYSAAGTDERSPEST